MSTTAKEFGTQLANPSDILSILLLIGGDVVQKAIAQLIGHTIRIPTVTFNGQQKKRSLHISIAPVAFSFGWVAHAFTNLVSAIGDCKLMPASDNPAMLVTCSNGFARETKSWILGRLLRDYEMKHPVDPRPKSQGGREESIRIDIFTLGPVTTPHNDLVWWLGWATLLLQVGIAAVPLAVYGEWGIMLITLCGNLLAAITCAIPQWGQEKWAGRKLETDNVTCLTRGNGYLHIMVFLGSPGSWNLETLATSTTLPGYTTRVASVLLAMLWTCFLIVTSGLKEHAWFLIGIGGVGMLQNVYAAGTSRDPSASNIHIKPFERVSTIIGTRKDYADDDDTTVDLDEDMRKLGDLAAWGAKKPQPSMFTFDNLSRTSLETGDRFIDVKCSAMIGGKHAPMPKWLESMDRKDGVPMWLEPLKPVQVVEKPSGAVVAVNRWLKDTDEDRRSVVYAVGVHGALVELEKWVPTAGLAMVQVFFTPGLKYTDETIRDNIHKKFWKRAYHTYAVRKAGEIKRRKEERARQEHSVPEAEKA